jgi:hypothetical protein
LPVFAHAIERAYLLGDPARASLPVENVTGVVRRLKLPRPAPVAMANVVCVEIEGDRVRF